MSALRALTEVVAARTVLHQMVRQQLILRYRRTLLGYLWTLINPLLMMTVTAIVFANLFKADLKTFAIFMFAGMVPWNCFSAIVSQSASALISNEALIKKIYLPKLLFPLGIAISLTIDSLLSLIALLIIILFIGGEPTWALLFLPFSYMLLLVFSFGIALALSIITVFFRDLQHVIVIVLQALFFLTPILYDKTALIGEAAYLLALNPVAPFVELFRAPIRFGVLPDMAIVTQCLLLATVSFVCGFAFFLAQEKKVVFRL